MSYPKCWGATIDQPLSCWNSYTVSVCAIESYCCSCRVNWDIIESRESDKLNVMKLWDKFTVPEITLQQVIEHGDLNLPAGLDELPCDPNILC